MSIPINTEELLLERQNLNKHRVDKNRLLLISIVNIITFLCAIFSMAFYQWIHISFTYGSRQSFNKDQQVSIWINLLYASQQELGDYYLTYYTIQKQICIQEDTFCLAIFYELEFVGRLCFGIFVFAFIISTYDVFRIIKFTMGQIVTRSKFFNERNSAINFKNNFRSFLMIISYAVGMTLNYFAMTLIQLKEYRYGISFWLFFASLIVFGLVSVWQNRKMSKISKQQLIIRLIENEKAMLRVSKESEQSKSDIIAI